MEKEVKKAEETQQTSTKSSTLKKAAIVTAAIGGTALLGFVCFKMGQKYSANSSSSNGTGLPVLNNNGSTPSVEVGEQPQKWQNPQPQQKWHNK